MLDRFEDWLRFNCFLRVDYFLAKSSEGGGSPRFDAQFALSLVQSHSLMSALP